MRVFRIGFTAVSLVLLMYVVCVGSPGTYEGVVYVPEGSSIGSVAEKLHAEGAISSRTVFKVAARYEGGVQAGAYRILPDESAFTLARRFAAGDTQLAPVRVTIPEGSTVREISEISKVVIPDTEEGFLFPDTYYFFPGVPSSVVVARMRERYEEVVGPLRPQIQASGHSELEILTMASILEKEARQYETMRIVSGILWKRIDIGMPLQVDAVFGYIYGRDTFSPTFTDLEIDSPYNTYKYRGLPPGPIGNPGLNALKAALDPEPSPYLYYLTGKDGTMHYARTFEQHVANRRFLR